ncbi:MAG TPA: ankyrin repeat domain-containing protein [Verrucomicrobiae bacterium]
MSKGGKSIKGGNDAFIKAAFKGNIVTLREFLQAGTSPDARDEHGRTALMRAAEAGRLAVVEALLKAGADAKAVVNHKDSSRFRCSAMLYAVEGKNATIVELLLAAGCGPDGETTDGVTAIGLAAEAGAEQMVRALVKAGAKLPNDILLAPVWARHEAVSLTLIEAGANPNAMNDLKHPVIAKAAETGQLAVLKALIGRKAKIDSKLDGATPLVLAAQNGHAACALELIRAGADVNLADLAKKTALMYAAVSGQVEVLRELVKAKAKLDVKSRDGKTALMLAAEKKQEAAVQILKGSGGDEAGYREQEFHAAAIEGNTERLQELLKAGVNVDALSKAKCTALILAGARGYLEAVRCLLEAGANPNLRDGEGADTLAYAAKGGHLDVVKALLQAGADVKRSGFYQFDTLTLAAMMGHGEVLKVLIAARAPIKGKAGAVALDRAIRGEHEETALILIEAVVDVTGKHTEKPLVRAAGKGSVKICEALLKAGCDPYEKDQFGDTALDVAKSCGHKEVLALLQQKKKAKPNLVGDFIEAAQKGDLKTVAYLIKEGVAVDARDDRGATALMCAARDGHAGVVKALLGAGAEVNAILKKSKKSGGLFEHMELGGESALTMAVCSRSVETVDLLLAAGAKIDDKECGHLVAMLLQTGEKNCLPVIERLLEAGMNPDARWPELDVSALEIAAQEGFAGMVAKLIEKGARLKSPTERDRAIKAALERGGVDIAILLIRKGIAREVKGAVGADVLVYAAMKGQNAVLPVILEQGTSIDARGTVFFEDENEEAEKITALMAAARSGEEETVKWLLNQGASVSVKDEYGQDVFYWAERNEHKNQRQICEVLRREKAVGQGGKHASVAKKKRKA